jgi:hypothetical protein
MVRLAHHFLAVLIAFAIIGGPTGPLAESAELMAPTTMADMLCDDANGKP